MTDLQVTLVPAEGVDGLWPKVVGHLRRATEMSEGRYDIVDLWTKLRSGEHQLWVVFDPNGGDVVAAITSTFSHYPQAKALSGQFLGGDRLPEWRDQFCDLFDRWGRDTGCQFVEFTGRAGWAKVLAGNGYREIFRLYQRDLGDT